MGRRNPELLRKADEFLRKYVEQGDNKNITEAAVTVRPELSRESALKWGTRILADPDARKKLHSIEQGALARIYELTDVAIDRLEAILMDTSTSKATQVKVIDMILRRILGGIPDTVILAKFSMFDGEESRLNLRDTLRQKMLEATYERVKHSEDAGVRTSESEAPEAPSVTG